MREKKKKKTARISARKLNQKQKIYAFNTIRFMLYDYDQNKFNLKE